MSSSQVATSMAKISPRVMQGLVKEIGRFPVILPPLYFLFTHRRREKSYPRRAPNHDLILVFTIFITFLPNMFFSETRRRIQDTPTLSRPPLHPLLVELLGAGDEVDGCSDI